MLNWDADAKVILYDNCIGIPISVLFSVLNMKALPKNGALTQTLNIHYAEDESDLNTM